MSSSIEKLQAFLNSLSPVEQSVLNGFTNLCDEIHFKKGEHLVTQGQSTNKVFFIISGLVRFYYITDEGNEVIKSFYSANGVVAAYSSLLSSQPANCNIECLEDTTVLAAPFDKVRALNDKDLNLQICARKIAEKEFISKDIREYEFLTMDSKDRYFSFKKRYPEIAERIPLKHIASYLGIRSETLSRLKSEN